jgi:hypothetical protein
MSSVSDDRYSVIKTLGNKVQRNKIAAAATCARGALMLFGLNSEIFFPSPLHSLFPTIAESKNLGASNRLATILFFQGV